MKIKREGIMRFITISLVGCFILQSANAFAQGVEVLQYSCSAQIFEAFEKERIPRFIEATGIEVELYICSSDTAVKRLTHYACDIASTTQKIIYPSREQGYVETVLCTDPIAMIVNEQNPVKALTEENLRGVFSRSITNWKDLSGQDQKMLLVVPGSSTGAYQNFQYQVMKQADLTYDLMTYLSTQVIDAVKQFPWAISFVSYGATANQKSIRVVEVDGRLPTDKGYPYQQEFCFITRGRPAGLAKVFVDFALSEKGREIIKSRGMIPAAP